MLQLALSLLVITQAGRCSLMKLNAAQVLPGRYDPNRAEIDAVSKRLNDLNGTLHGVIEKLTVLQKTNTDKAVSEETSGKEVMSAHGVSSLSALEKKISEAEKTQSALTTKNVKQDERIKGIEERLKQIEICPAGSGYIRNRTLNMCYKLHEQKATRDDADKICRSEKALLISLETQEKFDHISNYLKSFSEQKFPVLNGLLRENNGKYIWPNGKTTLPHWGQGEPSPSGKRDCGQILSYGNGDVECNPQHNWKLKFLCERLQQ